MAEDDSGAAFLRLEPQDRLDFRRPFDAVVRTMLSVKNSHPTAPIAFKVKTTAPKQYCVRPNSGRVPPGGSVDVAVLLQPMKEDPPADFKCKDKFLVQGVRIDDSVMQMEDETLAKELAELWASAEAKKKADPRWASENFAERKLKVVFLPPSPSSLSATASPASKPPTVTVTEASDAPHLTAPTGMQGSKTSVTPLDADEEALQLGQARQTIARLQQRIQEMEKENSDLRDGGLRQRKVAQSAVASSGAPAAQKSSSGGVNLILVVLIAIIAFVLGAFFY